MLLNNTNATWYTYSVIDLPALFDPHYYYLVAN
jgi:hypothetical protein